MKTIKFSGAGTGPLISAFLSIALMATCTAFAESAPSTNRVYKVKCPQGHVSHLRPKTVLRTGGSSVPEQNATAIDYVLDFGECPVENCFEDITVLKRVIRPNPTAEEVPSTPPPLPLPIVVYKPVSPSKPALQIGCSTPGYWVDLQPADNVPLDQLVAEYRTNSANLWIVRTKLVQ